MRTSCNGCRVLRKGCPEDCNIRPCLNWITSPDAQCNATVFLAKFYGRAGLMNFLNATSDHHRAEIFKSLLYEACGRIVDPIYGAVGLLWSNNWAHCEAAVNAVLSGNQIAPLQNPSGHPIAALNSFDIRHVTRPAPPGPDLEARPSVQTKPRSKRGSKTSTRINSTELGGIGPNDGSVFSVDSVDGSVANRVSPKPFQGSDDRGEIGLELSLNLGPGPTPGRSTPNNHRSRSVNP